MILVNYVYAVKNDDNTGNFYKFKSFYNLEENSSYIKSELMYRDIISSLTIESKLFFLYL